MIVRMRLDGRSAALAPRAVLATCDRLPETHSRMTMMTTTTLLLIGILFCLMTIRLMTLIIWEAWVDRGSRSRPLQLPRHQDHDLNVDPPLPVAAQTCQRWETRKNDSYDPSAGRRPLPVERAKNERLNLAGPEVALGADWEPQKQDRGPVDGGGGVEDDGHGPYWPSW